MSRPEGFIVYLIAIGFVFLVAAAVGMLERRTQIILGELDSMEERFNRLQMSHEQLQLKLFMHRWNDLETEHQPLPPGEEPMEWIEDPRWMPDEVRRLYEGGE